MFRYILPRDLESFLKKRVADHSQLNSLAEKLTALCRSSKRLTKKSNGTQDFYTFKIDFGRHAHRAIFERIVFHGQPYLMLRDIAWAHRYDVALRWKASSQEVNEDDIQNIFGGAFDVLKFGEDDTCHEAIEDDEPEEHQILFWP